MTRRKGNVTFYPNIRPGIGWNLFPGLRAYLSMTLKGPRFRISGDPMKLLKALQVAHERKEPEENQPEDS